MLKGVGCQPAPFRKRSCMDLQGLKITWLGPSDVRNETTSVKAILIDPWCKQSRASPEKEKNMKADDESLITNTHFDHMGDEVEIGKKHKPLVVRNYEQQSAPAM